MLAHHVAISVVGNVAALGEWTNRSIDFCRGQRPRLARVLNLLKGDSLARASCRNSGVDRAACGGLVVDL